MRWLVRVIGRHFGIGLATVLPFAFAIWVVVFVVNQVDGLVSWYIPWVYLHIPGLGFAIVLVAIVFFGFLSRIYISRVLFSWADKLFMRIPVISTLYTTAKELIDNLFNRKNAFQTPVIVEWPDERARVLGFITSEQLPESIDPDGTHVSVYLPNAFQFAGTTVIVPRDKVKRSGLTVEQTWKFALSAGLGQTTKSGGDAPPKAATPPQQPSIRA
ncbi:DUF502 domain-containing protein [Alicyclobacillus acidiphilus]|uniref:DUF502 domain-containing protein n=1 Tax=Alicyclobacillus acidiphilus TaxID=182455 RepID=UPI000830B9F4|nr:DUF502 domain-containing protein [Alicyclobacillus acidiphilus]